MAVALRGLHFDGVAEGLKVWRWLSLVVLRKVKRARAESKMADVMNVAWKSVESGGRLGRWQNGSLLTRVDEKAGEEGPVQGGWRRVEGKRLAFLLPAAFRARPGYGTSLQRSGATLSEAACRDDGLSGAVSRRRGE